LRTYQKLTEMGIPCTVVLDSAVGYIMERVDMVLLGCEAVVESGALVSSVGTSQVALIAKALQKPVYALAESYKFLRYYPLQQTDLPMPRASGDRLPLAFPTDLPTTASFPATTPAHSRRPSIDRATIMSGAATPNFAADQLQMPRDMIANQPSVDITYPDLVDFIITDLGSPLSPTSVSQYLVAQFSQ
jgi:translation initiation factor eIF-2B subunit alpha